MDYRKWKEVPLPPKMQVMEKDRRGYPVPFIIARDKNDIPRFQINDDRKVEYALANDLCAICGQKMGDDKWLVGGPMSAFHAHGAYIDSPTHYECLHYALQVCPYLAVSNYLKRIDAKNVKEDDFTDYMVLQDPTQDDNRVPFFVAVHITGYDIRRRGYGERYIIPHRPYKSVEFWNDGEKLTGPEVEKLWMAHVDNPKQGVK